MGLGVGVIPPSVIIYPPLSAIMTSGSHSLLAYPTFSPNPVITAHVKAIQINFFDKKLSKPGHFPHFVKEF